MYARQRTVDTADTWRHAATFSATRHTRVVARRRNIGFCAARTTFGSADVAPDCHSAASGLRDALALSTWSAYRALHAQTSVQFIIKFAINVKYQY